ncbi:glutamate-rich protein 2 isoform X2 [Haplochromis burtoni]|uniref:glutamate-rich protein 2 isoform X2 n=1 Tax=Haplochromis burtoni TaxID=8153 RepID=UPI0003BD08B6|nr:glutamate-rich protein 2 isoform X2 [Haplochromis burtoni]
MKGTEMLKSSGSKGTAEPLLVYKAKEDKEQTENVNVKCEDLKAPVGLLMKFLRALKDKYFQLAVKLCHMILIYEPDNPEASEFLPLIQKKLLEERHAEKSNEEESDEDDDDIDSGSDEDPSHSSSCSSSSASDDDDHGFFKHQLSLCEDDKRCCMTGKRCGIRIFTVDESCNVTQTKELILESIWSTLQSFVMVAIKLAQIKC